MRQVSGPSRRPSGTSLGVPQAEANVVSQNLLVSTSRKGISWCNKARLRGASTSRGPSQGLGPASRAGPRVWGPGSAGPGLKLWGPQVGPRAGASRLDPPQDLGARAPSLGTKAFSSLKSLLVGGWRRGGSQLKRLPQMWSGKGYPPTPPPPTPHPPCL